MEVRPVLFGRQPARCSFGVYNAHCRPRPRPRGARRCQGILAVYSPVFSRGHGFHPRSLVSRFARCRFGPSDTHCRPESQEPEAFAPWRTRCIFAQSRSWPGEPEPFSSSADLLAADSEFTTPTVGLGLDLFASSRRPLSALAFGPALYTRRRTLRAGSSALDRRNRSPTTAVGTLPAWTRRSLPGRVQRARPPEARILAERAPRRRP